MKTASERVNEDIAALGNDLCRLAGDFAVVPNRIRSWSKDRIMRSRNRVRDAVVGLESRAMDHVRDTSEALKDHGRYAVDQWRGGVEHRPITSVAIAFLAGWLVATVVDRVFK